MTTGNVSVMCQSCVSHMCLPRSQLQLPDPSLSPGILPSEIRVLVERRRQVGHMTPVFVT